VYRVGVIASSLLALLGLRFQANLALRHVFLRGVNRPVIGHQVLDAVEARQVIVTELEKSCNVADDGDVTLPVTNVTKCSFSEGLLRSIISLAPDQQLRLVRHTDGDFITAVILSITGASDELLQSVSKLVIMT
jgi:hypothetical protein